MADIDLGHFEKIAERLWDPNNWFGAVFYGIIFFIIAWFVSRFIRLAVTRFILRRNSELIDPTVVLFLTQLSQIAVYIVGLIIFFHIVPALQKLGTALLTSVSVMSVVFGLAAQNTLANLVAGCTLLLYRPFHIEDLIQVATPTGTEYGVVERLTLGYTMLRTLDDRLVVIPNSLMASQVSLNLNRRFLHAMAIISVGVTDTSHTAEVCNALVEAAQANPRLRRLIGQHTHPAEEGTVVISVRGWCSSESEARLLEHEVTDTVARKFEGKNYLFIGQLPPLPKSVSAA